MPISGPAGRYELRSCSLHVIALCIACGPLGAANAQAAAPPPSAPSAATSNAPAAAAALVADPSPDSPPAAADTVAAALCRNVHFIAYSTLEPSGQKVEESVIWDARSKSYLVRGPMLAMMLDDPGVSKIPSDADAPRTLFKIAVRAQLSPPIDRFCEYNFQEMANCDAHGNITYTQIYTDCDLQTLQHVVMLTPDQAVTLPLLDVRFQDVRGTFSNPLYLSAGSDLRERAR